MDKTTERIKADAEAATNNSEIELKATHMEYAPMIMRLFGYKEGYIAGATAENDRAQKLVDALEKLNAAIDKTWNECNTKSIPDRHKKEIASAQALSYSILQQWKEGKKEPNPVANVEGQKNEFVEILDNALDAGRDVLSELRKQNEAKEDALEKLKESIDYYRGIIVGLGDSETDDFNRSVYYQHSGDLYTAIKIIEKYGKYFNGLFKQQKEK